MAGKRPKDKRRRLLARWGWLGLLTTVVAATAIAMINRRGGEAVPAAGADVAGLTSVLDRHVGGSEVPIRFEDVTERVGINFAHMPVPRQSLLPEDMGSGVAAGDWDGDGFADLYFVNISGNVLPGATPDRRAGRARLYRNVRGTSFEDVTDHAGVGFVGCGMGAAWGDYDNDGDLDLYVTAYGNNVLYANCGDGTFADVTAAAGVQDGRFSAGCSWSDYDRDGDLDLYVCNYVDFVFREADRRVVQPQYDTEQPYTLNPSAYPPQANALFRNRGDGTFEEVAAAAGVADPGGKSLSASWVDFDNDGWVDLYVANDVSNNGVFRNNGDGTFEDIGPGSLAADYRGAMGIAVGDFDNDLDQDLLVTHWLAQENALYRNMTLDNAVGPSEGGRVWFMDDADSVGLGQISLDMVGWATGFCDFDNDGRRDLWLVNGSTVEQPDNHELLQPQRPFVFWNRGADGYVDVAGYAAPDLRHEFVGRGGAQLDFNNDGLVDLVLATFGGSARVFENRSHPAGHWLGVQLRQQGGNTFALGARVYVTTGGATQPGDVDRNTKTPEADSATQMAEVGCSSSYLSQDDLLLHFGLGERTTVDQVRIVWPDGVEEVHRRIGLDQVRSFEHAAVYPVRKITDKKGPADP